MEEGSFQHFTHEQHPLIYKSQSPFFKSKSLFSCHICNHLISPSERHYFCQYLICNFHIHKHCGELPRHINSSFHGVHHLTLLKRSSLQNSVHCFYCEKAFGDEYAYTCDECDFYMHTNCGLIPQPTITNHCGEDNGDDDHGVIQFSCHQHPMALIEVEGGEHINLGKKCFACQLPWSSPAYSCTTLTCENFFHKSCVDHLPQTIQHPFHSHKPLILQISKPRSCSVCFKKDCRLIFSCREIGCTFKIGTECAFLDTIVKCRSHDHLLSFVEGAYCDDIQCDACRKSYKELNNHVTYEIHLTRSFLFRCMECDFNLHFLCGLLPSTIKYKYHIHELTLADSIIEDNCHEYCCDVCEQERNPEFRIYKCTDCQYTAHIHCLIHEIWKVIKKKDNIINHVELWALGENLWKWESEMEEDDTISTKQKMTLRDLMNCLTQEEKKKMLQPSYDYKTTFYHYYKTANSRFHQLGSIEDFDTMKEFFQEFGSLITDFNNELYYYNAEEGLKIDEKYLRQEVIEVDGKYKVPKTLAPILKTLIDKYGDLGGDSSLTPQMKSVTITVLLIVIDKMCRTKMEDVTWDDLKEWYFYLGGIRRITYFKINQLLVDLRKKIFPVYWSFKAIRCKKQVAENLHDKIESLKAELKRSEENLEELEKIDMHEFINIALQMMP
ncbi:uncharacterized protein LOC133783738 [Humulus lupulus]|uniref:uncharacterized protein LOC133783738 n=1 Tax=Humulus lupulus TaxID=3486 RepID=UPI002B4100F1|nr:uncharacterized protein LOC133783738 [Humulus lupulus]